jgi:hypothetical protein
MDETTTKPCSKCCEPIPMGATRCSKCQSWQSTRAYLTGNPQALIGLLTMPFFLIFMGWMYSTILGRGEDFAKYRDQVEVVDHQFRVPTTDSRDYVNTVGRIMNNSPIKWTDVCIEVQYFDRDGKLLATKSDKNHSAVLLPKTEHAFQVNGTYGDPSGKLYASEKVFIRDARDARRWP